MRDQLDRHDRDLRALAYGELARCVIHGDPTAYNVLADGDPPAPTGLIDFDLADLEAPVADVSFCLWRSGRPSQPVRRLDLDRVTALVAGYHSVRPLSRREVALVPVCLRGRGLQMMVKRINLGVQDVGPLAELDWIDQHQGEILDAVAAGVTE